MRNDTAFMDRLHAYAPGWEFPKLDPRRQLTDHFALVSDFLSECLTRLRASSRAGVLDGRIHFGGALSGRDIEAVRKTVSGLVKLLYPDPSTRIPDVDLEWIVRLALEARRRVKEQQRRVFKSEFRNTHFSYTVGADGVETFVATPELQSDQAIETDPLPPGQIWAISPGSSEGSAGLYRIEVSHQPGSGMRILNQPAPPAFRESVKVGEQILFVQSRNLVGDRDPRAHEFTVQLRAIDADKAGLLHCAGRFWVEILEAGRYLSDRQVSADRSNSYRMQYSSRSWRSRNKLRRY
jgi:ATP-dependent Lon protease